MPAANDRPTLRLRQRGVGLIEVLIALFILSIGLLGMAALQARALSTNNSAVARSMATIDSYSILEAMRADRGQALAGSYNQTVHADNCPTGTSTLANAQFAKWCTQLKTDLGQFSSTQGTVNCNGSGYCTITIRFDDSRAGAAGSTSQTFVTNAVL